MPGQHTENASLRRDCEAVLAPQDDRVLIREGTLVTVTQAFGSSFTVYLKGRLYRIDGPDADALGKTSTEASRLGTVAS